VRKYLKQYFIDDYFKIQYCVLLLMMSFRPVVAASLEDVIAITKKSVVAVGTYMPRRAPKGVFRGTGFVIGNGKLIVTNAHVLPDTLETKNIEAIAIFFRQNEQIKMLEAETVAIDKTHDLAVLRLLSGSLPVLKLDSTKVREGRSIVFTGFPIGMVLGLYPVTHRGIVSAVSPVVIPQLKSKRLNAKLLKRLQQPFDVYQLDATAYPGNSGSPVYDAETGSVIGIVNKVFVKESKENVLSKPSGITYAIPVRHLNSLLRKHNLM